MDCRRGTKKERRLFFILLFPIVKQNSSTENSNKRNIHSYGITLSYKM